MIRAHRWLCVSVAIVSLTILYPILLEAKPSLRVRGSVGAWSYGYEDAKGKNHLWFMQTTRISVYRNGSPLSLHFSGGYIGDDYDDFSKSGRGRFLKGYIEYNDLTGNNRARLGRFFLYKGVALGVIDGLEYERRLNRSFSITLFSGLMGPIKRNFEFEDPKDAFSAGGLLRWTPSRFWRFERSSFTLSYTNQSREGYSIRHRIGLAGFGRLNKNITLLAVMHIRPTVLPLRRILGRLNYTSEKVTGLIEAGLYTPDVEEGSWFSSFELPFRGRLHFAVNRYLVSNKWGVGLDGTMLRASSSAGYRFGPVFTTPIGQFGYRLQYGDQANGDGPWVSLRYSPFQGTELYARAALTSYEWEEFNIQSDQLTAFQTGIHFKPKIYEDFTLSVEYQVYQSPQFTSDRRLMGGIVWRYDSGRCAR